MYNHVYNGSSWVPALSTADGQQKYWINMANASYGEVQYNLTVGQKIGIGTKNPLQELNVVGDVNITNNLIIEKNLTLGERIIFNFGETIDNLVDGWMRVVGNLIVDGDLNISKNLNIVGNITGGNLEVSNLNITGNITGKILNVDNLNVTGNFVALKQYYGNSSTGPGSFNVTGTGWKTGYAVAVPYQTIDGAWRLKFNIFGFVSTETRTFYIANISGVTFKAGNGYSQACAGGPFSSAIPVHLTQVGQNSGDLYSYHGSGTTDSYVYSCDVSLNSKPTWAD
jgi:hypothetical protein